MSRARQARAVAAITLFVALATSPALAGKPRLLRPGQYHGNEVTAVTGEPWLALLRGADGHDQLAPVSLRVDTVRDEILDGDGPPTGKLVSAGIAGKVVVLLNVPGMGPRPVATVRTDMDLSPGQPVVLSLRSRTYSIWLECGGPRLGEGSESERCSLVVRQGDRAQILRTYEAHFVDGAFAGVGDDAQPRLLWAGDLDGDDMLDLLLDLTDHYNVSRTTLFLSRGRGSGALLERIATHESVGC